MPPKGPGLYLNRYEVFSLRDKSSLRRKDGMIPTDRHSRRSPRLSNKQLAEMETNLSCQAVSRPRKYPTRKVCHCWGMLDGIDRGTEYEGGSPLIRLWKDKERFSAA